MNTKHTPATPSYALYDGAELVSVAKVYERAAAYSRQTAQQQETLRRLRELECDLRIFGEISKDQAADRCVQMAARISSLLLELGEATPDLLLVDKEHLALYATRNPLAVEMNDIKTSVKKITTKLARLRAENAELRGALEGAVSEMLDPNRGPSGPAAAVARARAALAKAKG